MSGAMALSVAAVAGAVGALFYALHRRFFSRFERGFLVTLLLAVAGAGLATAGLFGVWGYEAGRRLLFEETVTELRHVGAVLEAELHDGIGYAAERVQNLAREVAPAVARGNTEAVRQELRAIQRFTPRVLQVDVIDRHGAPIASSGGAETVDPPNRVAVAFNLDGKSFASDAYVSPVYARSIIYLSGPVLGADGGVIGAVSIRYDLEEYLSRLIRATRFGESAYTALVGSDGRFLASPVTARVREDVSSYPAVQRGLLGESGWIVARNHAGTERLMVYRAVKSPATLDPKPWVLLAEMDTAEATAPIRSLRAKFLLITTALVSACLLVAAGLARSIQQPVDRMVAMATRVGAGDLGALTDVSGHDEMGRLGGALDDMARGLQERERVKAVFGRYVTTQVSEEILKGQIDLGGVARQVTILFSDIRNFTTMSEQMTPAQVVGFLNDYFSEMVDAVFEQQGVLDKFMGDGIMATFGSLDDAPDHPRRAVLTALRMQARLAKLNGERVVGGHAPIAIGIGIHTDEVIVGNIGSFKRLEYTVIGDGVNTCSRVESANKEFGTTILITESTYEAVRRDFECRAMPEAHLKGKVKIPQLYEVVSIARPAATV